jgi:hypothetical protein
MGSWRRKLGAAVAAASLLAVGSGVTSSSATPTRPASPTSGCVGMDGTALSGGGPSRATVVVDTGGGPVWSACISFSGSITGIDALERAEATIVDLDPVYDQYAGLGRAVCRLRSVGSDPPDCLGKSADYWSFSVNGRVASVGAGAVTVRDGDVHGWAYGAGGTPRAATMGSRATTAPAPVPTTAAPPPAPTAPTPTSLAPPSATPTPSTSMPREVGARPGPQGETPPETTTSPAAGRDGDVRGATTERTGPSEGPAPARQGTEEEQELAAAVASTTGSDGPSDGDSGSGAGSLLGFGVALAAVGVAGLVVRRRRLGAA